jgi:hypothetical protein
LHFKHTLNAIDAMTEHVRVNCSAQCSDSSNEKMLNAKKNTDEINSNVQLSNQQERTNFLVRAKINSAI